MWGCVRRICVGGARVPGTWVTPAAVEATIELPLCIMCRAMSRCNALFTQLSGLPVSLDQHLDRTAEPHHDPETAPRVASERWNESTTLSQHQ